MHMQIEKTRRYIKPRRIYDLQALIEDELTQEISGVGGKLPVATLEVASDNLPLGHYS